MSRRRYPARRVLAWLLVVAAVVTGVLGGSVWWQERPLAEAEAVLQAGDARGAIALVNRYLRQYPEHGRALALKARALVAIGESATAIELFGRVGAEDARDFHAWAKALLQQQRWSAAAPLLEHVLEAGIDRADTLHELAACRAKLGDYDGALSAAEEFAREPGFAARGQLLVGTIHRDRGNPQRAADAWAEVLRLEPEASGLQVTAADFLLEYGRILTELGESNLATKLIERSVTLGPNADALVALGEARAQLGRTEEAETDYRRALALQPANIRALTGLAELAMSRGDAAGALQWLAPLASADSVTSSQTAFLLQRTYTRLGDRDAAEHWRNRADELRRRERLQDAAEQILLNTPQSDWATVIRAHRLAESGNWEEAEHILNPLASAARNQPFVQSLIEAVKARGPLPSLEGMPIRQY